MRNMRIEPAAARSENAHRVQRAAVPPAVERTPNVARAGRSSADHTPEAQKAGSGTVFATDRARKATQRLCTAQSNLERTPSALKFDQAKFVRSEESVLFLAIRQCSVGVGPSARLLRGRRRVRDISLKDLAAVARGAKFLRIEQQRLAHFNTRQERVQKRQRDQLLAEKSINVMVCAVEPRRWSESIEICRNHPSKKWHNEWLPLIQSCLLCLGAGSWTKRGGFRVAPGNSLAEVEAALSTSSQLEWARST